MAQPIRLAFWPIMTSLNTVSKEVRGSTAHLIGSGGKKGTGKLGRNRKCVRRGSANARDPWQYCWDDNACTILWSLAKQQKMDTMEMAIRTRRGNASLGPHPREMDAWHHNKKKSREKLPSCSMRCALAPKNGVDPAACVNCRAFFFYFFLARNRFWRRYVVSRALNGTLIGLRCAIGLTRGTVRIIIKPRGGLARSKSGMATTRMARRRCEKMRAEFHGKE
ncbi:hypothetical protein BC940DRAFT_60602 [Gongronella butleri]|nr:hypothetical protein BC940DRAFT_60602 [Gongronella butleri]